MTKHVSPLRQRMIDDMTFRNMSPNSQKVYTYAVANFSAFYGRAPDKLGIEHVREYRLHLMARGLKATSINPIIGALRFFYGTTLGDKAMAEQMPYARAEDTLPAVLTRDEVLRLFKAAPNLKIRTALITIYAAGLRVSEVVALTPRDINSARMVIEVRLGKGRKDRYVMLSEQMLAILRVSRCRSGTPAVFGYLTDEARLLEFGSIERWLSSSTPLWSIHPIGLIKESGLPTGSLLEAEVGSVGGAETHQGLRLGANVLQTD